MRKRGRGSGGWGIKSETERERDGGEAQYWTYISFHTRFLPPPCLALTHLFTRSLSHSSSLSRARMNTHTLTLSLTRLLSSRSEHKHLISDACIYVDLSPGRTISLSCARTHTISLAYSHTLFLFGTQTTNIIHVCMCISVPRTWGAF